MVETDKCQRSSVLGLRATAVLMLTVSLAAVILPLYAAILQLFTEKTEFSNLLLAMPTWILCMPGILAVTVVLLTIWHAIRHRASLKSLRRWVAALAILQLIAAFAYWILLLRRTCKGVMDGTPDVDQQRRPPK